MTDFDEIWYSDDCAPCRHRAIKCTVTDNKPANINDTNYSLSIVLTAIDQNWKNHKKVILLSITLTFRRRDGG